MTPKSIDGLLLKEMLIAGATLLDINHEEVDSLNVFPVPDGDTGTNMSLTMKSTVKDIEPLDEHSASAIMKVASKGALKGARGNSGVILSQILRGFSKSLDNAETIDQAAFVAGLKKGSETAYKAVMKPKEGTILTVIRVISEDAERYSIRHPDNLSGLLDKIVKSGEVILEKTPDMLPALKQAGVVDSGGQGLLYVLKGWRAAYHGEKIEKAPAEPEVPSPEEETPATLETLKFRYEVSYLIKYLGESVTEDDVNKFRTRLTRIGEKVSVENGPDSGLSVRLCTNVPGKCIQYACDLGEVVDLKFDNLAEKIRERIAGEQAKAQAEEQARREAEEAERAAGAAAQAAPVENAAPLNEYGFVAVSIGSGFSQIFTELGVSQIVEGGQTMNPSIEDILAAINRVDARNVFVLPNNSNIVLAATQAAELSEKTVCVLPTKNTAMGIGAVIAFEPDADLETNRRKMTEASENVKTGQITYAVRDTVFEDKEIHEGDIIGIHNGCIEVVGRSVHDIAVDLVRSVVEESDSLITIYYGQDVKEEDATALAGEISTIYPEMDVEVQYGGQPLYYYLIATE